jgi:hypothetical protein
MLPQKYTSVASKSVTLVTGVENFYAVGRLA